MDYKRIYNRLIEHRQNNILTNGYIERHHILPRSLGGTNENSNIVALTGREHYIAHLLLARFNKCQQTVYALWMMQMKSSKNYDRPCIKTGRMYEWARKEFAKYASKNAKISSKGERNSQYGTRWICNIKLKQNKKISKDANTPNGWISGRNKWIEPAPIKSKKKNRLESGKTLKQEQCYLNQSNKYLIDGEIFIGLKSICTKYNLTHPAVLNRLNSSKFPLWIKTPA